MCDDRFIDSHNRRYHIITKHRDIHGLTNYTKYSSAITQQKSGNVINEGTTFLNKPATSPKEIVIAPKIKNEMLTADHLARGIEEAPEEGEGGSSSKNSSKKNKVKDEK